MHVFLLYPMIKPIQVCTDILIYKIYNMTTKYTCSNCFHPENTKYTALFFIRLLFHFSPEDILFNTLKKRQQ